MPAPTDPPQPDPGVQAEPSLARDLVQGDAVVVGVAHHALDRRGRVEQQRPGHDPLVDAHRTHRQTTHDARRIDEHVGSIPSCKAAHGAPGPGRTVLAAAPDKHRSAVDGGVARGFAQSFAQGVLHEGEFLPHIVTTLATRERAGVGQGARPQRCRPVLGIAGPCLGPIVQHRPEQRHQDRASVIDEAGLAATWFGQRSEYDGPQAAFHGDLRCWS